MIVARSALIAGGCGAVRLIAKDTNWPDYKSHSLCGLGDLGALRVTAYRDAGLAAANSPIAAAA
jgi:hypothetical protein